MNKDRYENYTFEGVEPTEEVKKFILEIVAKNNKREANEKS